MSGAAGPAVNGGGASWWRRLRRQLWQPPRPHGEQPRERVVGPLELFYDLVTVVLVAQAAHHLSARLDWRGVGQYAAVFGLVWLAWVSGSLHHELHGREDARGRTAFLAQILVLVPLGAFIPEAGGERGAAFAVTAGILFAVLALLWLLASRGDQPEFRRLSEEFVAGTAVCAVALGLSALLPAGARVWTWGLVDLAYLGGFAVTIRQVMGRSPAAFTVTDAVVERFGLLIIIVLGETVTGVVTGLEAQPVGALVLAVALVCVVVGFGAWWTYFDFSGGREPRRTPAASLQWMLGHVPLTAAVAAMGAAMVDLVEQAHHARTSAATAWVLCGGAALVLAGTLVVAGSLKDWRAKWALYRRLSWTCAATAAACLVLAALRPEPLVLGILLVVLFSIPWSVAVAYRVRRA
ncbi:low temperature requirement protein A [Streptomyces sp. NPDC020917]|uniref:low temperature requirement protein A n=1 Tax=Streptomyces sp. NPDC020917 TaxID=3365102 RepID=UPI00378F7915